MALLRCLLVLGLLIIVRDYFNYYFGLQLVVLLLDLMVFLESFVLASEVLLLLLLDYVSDVGEELYRLVLVVLVAEDLLLPVVEKPELVEVSVLLALFG